MSELDLALKSCEKIIRKVQQKNYYGSKTIMDPSLERLFNLLRCPVFREIYLKQKTGFSHSITKPVSLKKLKKADVELNHSFTIHGAEVGYVNPEKQLEISVGDLVFEPSSIGNYRSLTHLINKNNKFDEVILEYVKKDDILTFMADQYKNRYQKYVKDFKRFGFVIKLLNTDESNSRKKYAIVNGANGNPEIKLLEPYNGIPRNSVMLVYNSKILFPFSGSDVVNSIFCGEILNDKNLVFAKLPEIGKETSFL